jgi:hypothetical protein
MKERKIAQVNARISKTMKAKLQKYMDAHDCSEGRVIRLALERYFKKEEEKENVECSSDR